MTTITPDTADHELLRLTHAGRADAFTALYRRHQGPLYRYALMRCGSADMAADVVQEAFMGLAGAIVLLIGGLLLTFRLRPGVERAR